MTSCRSLSSPFRRSSCVVVSSRSVWTSCLGQVLAKQWASSGVTEEFTDSSPDRPLRPTPHLCSMSTHSGLRRDGPDLPFGDTKFAAEGSVLATLLASSGKKASRWHSESLFQSGQQRPTGSARLQAVGTSVPGGPRRAITHVPRSTTSRSSSHCLCPSHGQVRLWWVHTPSPTPETDTGTAAGRIG